MRIEIDHIMYISIIVILILVGTSIYMDNYNNNEKIKYLQSIKNNQEYILNNQRTLSDNQYDITDNQEMIFESCEEDKTIYCPQSKTEYIYYCPDDKFTSLIQNVAYETEYQPNIYDCTEFSQELVNRLKSRGWKAKTKLVTVECDSDYWDKDCEQFRYNHMIVQVDKLYIEATTGEIIPPEDYIYYGLR